MRRLALLLALVAPACGKRDPAPSVDPGRAPTERAARAKAPSTDPATRGAAASPAETASGGEESSAATITQCPDKLAGAEYVSRVITRACGAVLVADDYHLNNNAQLTLEAGATLAFKEGTSLNVGYNDSAKLVVRGTAEEPVTFTSAGDKVAGAWKGVHLYEHADRSTIDHLVIEYAGQDGEDALSIEAQDVVLVGSTVRSVRGVGVGFGKHGTVARFSGNSFDKIGRWPVSLPPEAVSGMEGPNSWPAGSVVHVSGGTIDDQVTWRPLGAPYYVSDDVHVEGRTGEQGVLTLTAGVEVRFGPEAHLLVGYSEAGAVRAAGTEEAPVLLTSMGERRPGAWPGAQIYGHGEGSFENTIFEFGGSKENVGVLRVEGTVSMSGCALRQNLGGVALLAKAKVKLLDGTSFEDSDRGAIWLHPPQLGALGSSNRYAPGERLELDGGTVDETATWRAQDAVIEVLGDVRVDSRSVLTVESGARFAMKDKSRIVVGARDTATLRLMGTATRPIVLAGIRDDVGSWGGVRLGESSRDSVLEEVRLRNAGGEGGVYVEGDANATVTNLSCARCAAPTLAYSCVAKVVAVGIRAEEGTERGEVRQVCP